MSLSELLELVERWQKATKSRVDPRPSLSRPLVDIRRAQQERATITKARKAAILAVDIPALQKACQQHAEQLREALARCRREAFAECTAAEEVEAAMTTALDFLTASPASGGDRP